jgi:creatinine amidohydrolase
MKPLTLAAALLILAPFAIPAQTRSSTVEMEFMTWPEIKRAIQEQGKTTVLFFNGGTEQRGPQGITAAHTLIGRTLAREIAEKLGNALAAPVLPFSPANASADLPGSIGIPTPLFIAINEQIAEQLIANGFKNVVLLGDSGGGQQELGQLAKKLTEKYTAQGIRVVHAGDVYTKVRNDFNQWASDHGYPAGSHASIKDTSEMLYLGGDQWIRKELLPTALGDPVRKPGEPRDPNAKRVNNGISGDARRSSAEIGKIVHEMKLNYAVAQIRQLIGDAAASSRK